MELSFLEQLLDEQAEEESEEYRHVWTVAVVWKDHLCSSDIELVGKARELADSLGAYVKVLLVGEQASEAMAQELIAYGADEVYLGPGYPTDQGLADFVQRYRPEVLLFSDVAGSRQLAPRLAQRLAAALVTHAVDLAIDAEQRALLVIRPIYEGAVDQVVQCLALPQMATVRPGSFPMPYRDQWRQGKIEPIDLSWQPQPRLSPLQPGPLDLPLQQAQIIVAGGRGMREAGWSLIEELAAAFARAWPQRRVAVAGSRGALDEGWISAERMVDITGQRVAPDLYVACGIRGTLHHFAGMERSRCIVAINHNPDAPIFRHADFGIVGDVAEVIPALIRVLEDSRLATGGLHV